VTLEVEGHAKHGRIGNLGVGGIFVLTHVSAPERWLGRNVGLRIRVDGSRAEWLHATGQINRIAAEGVAITFTGELPGPLRHMVDELTTASRASDRVLSVVLIDADTERRSAMAAGFRDTGCSVVEAATPLEAIVRLGEASFEPDVIAVADSATTEAEEMRVFVERDHPDAKLVTIGDEVLGPDGIVHWLSSANPKLDLPKRVRDVLVRPGTSSR
jgi:hypothetical protein